MARAGSLVSTNGTPPPPRKRGTAGSPKPPMVSESNPLALTEKDVLFVNEYMKDFVAQNAYMKAYPNCSKKTAASSSWKMLDKPAVQAELVRLMNERTEKLKLEAAQVLREISFLSFSRVDKLYSPVTGALLAPDQWPEDMKAAVASVETTELFEHMPGGEKQLIGYTKKVKLYDKNAALDKLMRHLGQYEKDNIQKAFGDGLSTMDLQQARDKLAEIMSRAKGGMPA
jgi:phage terminase small subunit